MGKLDDKVALITGAARGQGAAEARQFVEEGAKVMVTDVLDDLGEKVAADLGDAARWCHLDVSDSAQWAHAVDETIKAFGKLNVLINNAGIFPMALMEDMDEELFMTVIRVNQLGCWLGMKSVIEPMRAAGGGAIVNTASTAGMAGFVGLSAYVGSKHAVRGMSKTAAMELGKYGIRVNSVYPGGIVGADLPEGMDRAVIDQMFQHLPVARPGTPLDIARAMVFLASDDSAYCTGSELQVDGGALTGSALQPPPT